jgi:hypothetical protein
MRVISLINAPHAAAAPYAAGADPSPAAARAAAALAQARARIRSREGGAGAAGGAGGAAVAPYADTIASVTRARQLLESIGAADAGSSAPRPAAQPQQHAPLAGLLAAAGEDDLT